jgi:hypothetical protein
MMFSVLKYSTSYFYNFSHINQFARSAMRSDKVVTMTDAAAAIAIPDSLWRVTIPAGVQDIGVEFDGSPPRIVNIDPKSPLREQFHHSANVPYDLHMLQLPNVEVINFITPTHLKNLIASNVGSERYLFISSTPQYVDASIGKVTFEKNQTAGAIYKHALPTISDLGVTFTRFPPVVQHVATNSPLYGRLVTGQTVQALLVPGSTRFDLEAGEFEYLLCS